MRRADDPLHGLGITTEEVDAYDLLAAHPGASMPELAARWTGTGPLAPAVERLVVRGLAEPVPGRPQEYRVSDPGPLLEPRLRRLEAVDGWAVDGWAADGSAPDGSAAGGSAPGGSAPDGWAGDAGLHRLLREASRLPPDDSLSSELAPVEAVLGHFDAVRRLRQVQAGATARVRGLGDVSAAIGEPVDLPHESLLRRGVACQMLYSRDDLQEEGALARVASLGRLGQESRVLPTLPTRLYLVDARAALLPYQDVDGGRRGLTEVRPTTVLEALGSLCDGLWRRALPVEVGAEPASARRRGSSPDQAAQILALLRSGVTDDVVARRLGVSYRTLQRRISELMGSMGVRSRFQLGIQAALREAAADPADPAGPNGARGSIAEPPHGDRPHER